MLNSPHLKRRSISNLINNSNKNITLKRTFTLFELIIFGIGAIIGGGIFVLPGIASATAGPSIIICFLIGGFVCMGIGLCYAELASMIPLSGGTYIYIEVTLGKIIGYISALTVIFVQALSTASVAQGSSEYLHDFILFNMNIDVFNYLKFYGINTLPLLIIILLTFILYKGNKTSSILNKIFVAIKIIVLLLFIAVCAGKVNYNNWVPFFNPTYGVFSSITNGLSMVVLAYAGFDVLSSMAQEAKNPKKDIPLAIIISISICAILYIIIATVMTGVVPYYLLNNPEPIMTVLTYIEHSYYIQIIIAMGSIIATISVILVILFGISRWIFSLSNDGVLPKYLSRIHDKYKTPSNSIILSGIIIGCLSATIPLQDLVKLANIGFLIIFILISSASLALRSKVFEIYTIDSFKLKYLPIINIINIIFCLILLKPLIINECIIVIIFFSLVIISYFMNYYFGNIKNKW